MWTDYHKRGQKMIVVLCESVISAYLDNCDKLIRNFKEKYNTNPKRIVLPLKDFEGLTLFLGRGFSHSSKAFVMDTNFEKTPMTLYGVLLETSISILEPMVY